MEIGSEFWEVELKNHYENNFNDTTSFLLSGRTALDYLIRDIKMSYNVKSVYMPTYCCHSMLQPFIDNEISIEFYEVSLKNGKFIYDMDSKIDCDIIFIMQYFGFSDSAVGKYIDDYKELGKLVIEDATHSWLLTNSYQKKSDYVFASFRKWTGLATGAVAIKNSGPFLNEIPTKLHARYTNIRKKAAYMKANYIKEGKGEKKVFLNYFNEAESLLENDYQNYRIDKSTENQIRKLDLDEIKRKRKRNALYLITELNKIDQMDTLILTSEDAPLFIPIFVNDGLRDKLRIHLIKNDIYCPIHWPISDLHIFNNKYLYNNGISIVCDQRYGLKEMEKIIKVIKSFFGG